MLSGMKPLFQNKKFILGSGSKARFEMLSKQGLDVTVDPSGAEENLDKAQYADPRDYVRATCRLKMDRMLEKYREKEFDMIITADTVIFDAQNNIHEKPADFAELQRFLRAYSGAAHTAFTALSLAFRDGGRVTVEEGEGSARVFFPPLDERVIANYGRDCPEVFEMSGGYSVNGPAASFIERVEGDVNAVRGLPLTRLCQMVAAHYGAQGG